jgi:hypothetical protein
MNYYYYIGDFYTGVPRQQGYYYLLEAHKTVAPLTQQRIQ